jgi:hypothetical protein
MNLSSRTESEAELALTKKLALPAPDGPHNQTESTTAIEAVDVGLEA